MCILFCLNEIENFKNVFLNIIFYLLLFVILDVFIQHLFHIDILGNKIDSSHGRRLSGPFGDEKVAGTFITKLFFVSLILFYKKNYFKKIIFPLIFLTFTAVILTNERSATIMFMSSVIIFITFYKFKLVHKMLFFLSLIFLIFTVLYTDDNLKKHFIEIPLKAFGDNHHKAHFLTFYEISRRQQDNWLQSKLIERCVRMMITIPLIQNFQNIDALLIHIIFILKYYQKQE